MGHRADFWTLANLWRLSDFKEALSNHCDHRLIRYPTSVRNRFLAPVSGKAFGHAGVKERGNFPAQNGPNVAKTFLAPAWSDNDRNPMRQILEIE